jgi:hypothetical protein
VPEGRGLHDEQRRLSCLRDACRGHHPPAIAEVRRGRATCRRSTRSCCRSRVCRGHELGARPTGITGYTDELPQGVAPEQRGDDLAGHVHGSGRPLGARTTGHPRAIGVGSAAVNGPASAASRRRMGPRRAK